MGAARRLAVGLSIAVAAVAAGPAAWAVFTGTTVPTQSVTPHQLVTPSSLACTAPGNNSVALTWSDSDGSAVDPYTGQNRIDSYVVERSTNGGAYGQIGTSTTASYSDTSFGLLGLGDTLVYRVKAKKSTNWFSAYVTGGFTAKVTSLLIFVHVSCP